jgi:hypothetical protein
MVFLKVMDSIFGRTVRIIKVILNKEFEMASVFGKKTRIKIVNPIGVIMS